MFRNLFLPKIAKLVAFLGVLIFAINVALFGVSRIIDNYVETDYNTFISIVREQAPTNITISPFKINAITDNHTIYQTTNTHSEELISEIKSLGVPVTTDLNLYISLSSFGVVIIAFFITKLQEKRDEKKKIFNAINRPVYNNNSVSDKRKSIIPEYQQHRDHRQHTSHPTRTNIGHTTEAQQMTSMSDKMLCSTKINTRFADVAGVDEAKVEVQEIVDFLKNPQKFTSFGIRVPRGLILYGLPGTGKTLLAKAIAGEADVPFYALSGSDFVEMYVGVGAARIRSLFEEARANKPCIIFIDEIDALARKRGANNHSNEEKDQTLNQLLVEMDGFEENDGIVVIGATNRLDILDPAVLRPHRFDRHVEVPVPDKTGRIAILKIHAKNKKLEKDIDFANIANKTTGFSGAQLENVLNEAALLALRKNQKAITNNDIDEAISKVMVGLKKAKNNLSDKEKKIVAYHEAGHAIATKLLAKKVVEKITILPTNNSLGYVMHGNADEQFLYSKEELFNNICIALAGRASEKIYFNDNNVTNGASNDFQKATNIARDMVFSYGMSSLGNISLAEDLKGESAIISDNMKDKAYDEVQNILKEAEKVVTAFLVDNDANIQKLVSALLEKETLYKDEVNSILSA